MTRRPRPGPLLIALSAPRCPVCTDQPEHDGVGWLCPSCDAWWLSPGAGVWLEPHAPKCTSTVMPFVDRPDLVGALTLTWGCVLADGHDEWHRTPDLPGLEWDDTGHVHHRMPGLPPVDTTTGEACECRSPVGSGAQ